MSDSWKGEGVYVKANASINGDALMVILTVQSTNPDKRINYQSWGDSGATVTDSKGNRLKSRNHDLDLMLVRGKSSGPVDADNPRYDITFFDLPVSTADYVTLELDGRNVERRGTTIRLRVTKDDWTEKVKGGKPSAKDSTTKRSSPDK